MREASSVCAHFAVHRFKKTCQGERQRRFAGAVRADQRGDLPLFECKIDAGCHGFAVAPDGEILRAQHRFAGAFASRVVGFAAGMDRTDTAFAAHIPSRHPDAQPRKVEIRIAEHLIRRTVRHDDGVSFLAVGGILVGL